MKKIILFLASWLFFLAIQAQHEHHAPSKKLPLTQKATKKTSSSKKSSSGIRAKSDTIPGKKDSSMHRNHQQKDSTTTPTQHIHHGELNDTTPAVKNVHSEHSTALGSVYEQKHSRHEMSHAFSIHLPMTRNGSGTGWLPDASPMYGYMIHRGDWVYMFHGSVFARYNNQDFTNRGNRGADKFDAPTWFMFMGQRKTGRYGLFHFSSMFSLDPLIEGGRGYPLLFQTGESFEGEPIVDRQHPHDLISELAISYSHSISRDADIFAYLGYPGEPALGPVTFMHRPSSLNNPNSPISHHWVDATHITYGVATLGLRLNKVKLEGSVFTGREPDEKRYDFDKPRFDSWSGRLSYNPGSNWALQASHAFIKSPEELHPEQNVYKTTVSAIYAMQFQPGNRLDATVLWGMNKIREHKGENAFLAEGAWRKNRNSLYTRYELTEKSAEELVLTDHFNEHRIFPVHAFTLGNNYDLVHSGKIRLAAGAQWSIYGAPNDLDFVYGKHPMAFQIYLRLYPALMSSK